MAKNPETVVARAYDPGKDQLDFKFTYNKAETDALHKRLNRAGRISVEDLRRVSLWKSNRVLQVSKETLAKLEIIAKTPKLKITDALVKQVLADLVTSRGIGFPMASAILKFIRPDVFPIIDVRAYRALTGKRLYYSTYTYEKYIKYAATLVQIARRTALPLRQIDEQLYCFDEKYNGTF